MSSISSSTRPNSQDHRLRPHRHLVDRLDRAQRVLVDRVAVEEVVLDEEAHPAELRQEAAQEPRLVHRAQGEADAPAPAQDVHEERGHVPRPRAARHQPQGEALADRQGQLVRERHPPRPARPRTPAGPWPLARSASDFALRRPSRTSKSRAVRLFGERCEEPAGGLFRRAAERAAEDLVQVGRAPVVVAHELLRGEEASRLSA